MDATGVLPPRDIPGAVDPTITQANIDTTICRPGYARAVRPSYVITDSLKRRLMDAQQPGEGVADHELDHMIPIFDQWRTLRQARPVASGSARTRHRR
jgi:hypothetical protein